MPEGKNHAFWPMHCLWGRMIAHAIPPDRRGRPGRRSFVVLREPFGMNSTYSTTPMIGLRPARARWRSRALMTGRVVSFRIWLLDILVGPLIFAGTIELHGIAKRARR